MLIAHQYIGYFTSYIPTNYIKKNMARTQRPSAFIFLCRNLAIFEKYFFFLQSPIPVPRSVKSLHVCNQLLCKKAFFLEKKPSKHFVAQTFLLQFCVNFPWMTDGASGRVERKCFKRMKVRHLFYLKWIIHFFILFINTLLVIDYSPVGRIFRRAHTAYTT